MPDCVPVRRVPRRGVLLAAGLMIAALAAPALADDVLTWKKGDFKLKGVGYFQGELRAFPGWDVDPDTPGLRSDWGDIRRWRVGFEAEKGKLYGEAMVDIGPAASAALGDNPDAKFQLRRDLKNAYLEYPLTKHHYLRVGHFKLPTVREFMTPAAKTDFIERSMLSNGMASGRDWGVMARGSVKVVRGLDYLLGVFAGDGWSEDFRAETTVAGRFVLEAAKGLQVATSASFAKVEADPEDALISPNPKGMRGRSASEWSFFRRMHVDGQRRRLSGDVLYNRGALTLKAEVMHSHDERKGQGSTFTDLPPIAGLGWSTVGIWRVRGPKSKKDENKEHPLDLLVRLESLRFDDTGDSSGFEGIGNRARNVRPETGQALSGGVTYGARPWLRFMANAILDRYSDALLAPESGRKGPYLTLLARVHVEIP